MFEPDEPQIYTVQMQWNEWIGWRRNRLDITKQSLAQVLEAEGFSTTRQTLWRIETGRVPTTIETRRAIEGALDVIEAGRAHAEAVA